MTGYFFKREGYRSNGGVHVAPTLLARKLSINNAPNGIPSAAGIVPTMTGAVMAIGLGLLITLVGFAITDERSLRQGRIQFRQQPQLALADVSVPVALPLDETLKRYSDSEQYRAISGAYGPLLSRQVAREHAVRDEWALRQSERDSQQRRNDRNAEVVADWASRQSEYVPLERNTDSNRNPGTFVDRDRGNQLDSDALAPARTRIVTPTPAPVPVAPPVYQRPAEPIPQVETASTRTVVNESNRASWTISTPPEQPPTTSSQISYGASKLSEWEEEIAKMNRRRTTIVAPPAPRIPTAAEQLEQDRIVREQETQEQLRRHQLEIERRRIDQQNISSIEYGKEFEEQSLSDRSTYDRSDRHRTGSTSSPSGLIDSSQYEHVSHRRTSSDRHDSERAAREQIERERYERERFERQQRENQIKAEQQRKEYDDSLLNDSAEFNLRGETSSQESDLDSVRKSAKRRGGGWGWPRRKKNAELSDLTDQSPKDEPAADDDVSGNSSSSGWGRSRKRRKWRNDETT